MKEKRLKKHANRKQNALKLKMLIILKPEVASGNTCRFTKKIYSINALYNIQI